VPDPFVPPARASEVIIAGVDHPPSADGLQVNLEKA
jgi:hypothetical protein